jgi:hypothetical protein
MFFMPPIKAHSWGKVQELFRKGGETREIACGGDGKQNHGNADSGFLMTDLRLFQNLVRKFPFH